MKFLSAPLVCLALALTSVPSVNGAKLSDKATNKWIASKYSASKSSNVQNLKAGSGHRFLLEDEPPFRELEANHTIHAHATSHTHAMVNATLVKHTPKQAARALRDAK